MRTILVAAGVAVVLGLLGTPLAMRLFTRRGYGPALGVAPFALWVALLIAGWSNAVNLTDGLDGLATG